LAAASGWARGPEVAAKRSDQMTDRFVKDHKRLLEIEIREERRNQNQLKINERSFELNPWLFAARQSENREGV
jgi:hypothetical protein